ncbi:MAG: hypothetical protein WCS90_01935 [Bacilli bacterium]
MKPTTRLSFLFVLAGSLLLASCGGGNATSSSLTNSSVPASSSPDSSSTTSSSVSSSVPEVTMAGMGAKADPYLPLTAKHWLSLASLVCGKTMVYVSLSNDIDLAGTSYTPIGTLATPANIHLDGKGFTISGLNISASITDVTAYGLFGAIDGVVDNVTIKGEIAYTATAKTSYAGLLCGIGLSMAASGVHTEGKITVLHDSAITNALPIVGGIIGYQNAADFYFCTIEESSAKVEIDASSEAKSLAGGLVGYTNIDTDTWGATTINNSYVETASIKAGAIAGGLLGFGYYYTSIVNSFAVVDSISLSAAKDGLAGGLAGAMFYETAITNSIAEIGTINAGATTSQAGDIAGSVSEDDYANGYGRTAGTSLFQNYAKGATLTGAATTPIAATNKITDDLLVSTLFSTMQFTTNVWTLADHKLPELKAFGDETLRNEITYTVAQNNETDATETFTSEAGQYQGPYSPTAAYADHTYINTYYDAACTIDYRWYVPNNDNTKLYNAWYDATKIAGFYGGENAVNGVLAFAKNGKLVWLQTDNFTAEGTWWSDGTHLVFNTDFYENEVAEINQTTGAITFIDPNDEETGYNFTKKSEFFGYWKSDSGNALYLDGNGVGYYFDGDTTTAITYTETSGGFVTLGAFGSWDAAPVTKSGDTISFTLDDGDAPVSFMMTAYNGEPDYSKKAFVGSFNGSYSDSSGKSVSIKFLGNGNIQIYKAGSKNVYGYGGYRLSSSSNVITIKSSALSGVAGDYKWNPGKKALVKTDGSIVYAQTGTFSTLYATADKSVRIFVFSDANYLVVNNNLDTTTAITGTMGDGQTIKIGTDEYTISGTTLAKKNAIDYTPLVNTYEMFIGTSTTASNNVLSLKADKTGTYNGDAITYTYDGTKVNFTYKDLLSFDLTFDTTAKTLSGTMSDGDTTTAIVFKVKASTPVVSQDMLGTFSGTVTTAGANSVAASVKITSDGKITYTISDGAAIEGVWTGNKNQSIEANWDDFDGDYNSESGTITYNSTTDSITLDLSGAYTVSGTIARAV